MPPEAPTPHLLHLPSSLQSGLTMPQDGPFSTSSPKNGLGDVPSMSPRDRRSPAPQFKLPISYISPGQLAFSAMQFLPVPILVLNNLKTVVLANEAMGRLLGIPTDSSGSHDDDSPVMNQLRGQTLPQVGIDMLQDGRPVWVSWDDLLDSVVIDSEMEQPNDASRSDPFNLSTGTGTNLDNDTSVHPLGPASTSKPSTDCVIEVVIASRSPKPTISSIKHKKHDSQVLAKMIITVFQLDEHQTYFNLTFVHTESPSAQIVAPRKSVARSSAMALEAADRKTISNSNPPSATSSLNSPGSTVSMSSSPFLLPMGPPSRAAMTSTPSLFRKMSTIKDALLDNTQMPILAMWKDGSAPVMNSAARELFVDSNSDGPINPQGFDILQEWLAFPFLICLGSSAIRQSNFCPRDLIQFSNTALKSV
jgi:hypothetical protein